jgi:transcription factor IIIB 90 kDa subunit
MGHIVYHISSIFFFCLSSFHFFHSNANRGQLQLTHYMLFPPQYLLSEPILALKRTQLHLLPHLNFTLPRTNPCVHLPALASHLSVLASTSPTSLPKDTLAFLRPLLSATALQSIMRTARMLYDLTTLESRISTGTNAGATSCALLLLSLEAHAGPSRPVPHALVLAAQLGAAIGARGAAVMARYRILVDIIEADAARVPWLAGASATGSKRVSRRSWVAKAVLDVLQFHNQLEQAGIAQRGGPIGVEIEGDDDGDVIERGNQGEDEAALDAQIATVELKMTDSTGSISRAYKDTRSTTETTMGPVPRYKKLRTATTQAASFLLDPLAHCAPARATLAHTTYLLSSDTASEPAVLPTRLQLLAVERGNAEAVHDDELFSDGELEGIVIGTDEQAGEERERRAQALQMVWGDEHAEATGEDLGVETVQAGKRKARVDMNKLATFLDSDDPFVALGIEESSPSDEGGGETGDGQGFFRQLEDAEWE